MRRSALAVSMLVFLFFLSYTLANVMTWPPVPQDDYYVVEVGQYLEVNLNDQEPAQNGDLADAVTRQHRALRGILYSRLAAAYSVVHTDN